MSFKAFLKKCLLEYFIITTCVTAAIAILGLILDPGAKFGYESLFSPLIFGFVSLIPSFATYSSRELSFRQALIRKIFHFILLEAVLLGFGFWTELLQAAADIPSFALTVLIVYLAVNLISWKLAQKEAGEINKMLKSLQGRSI